MSELSYSALLWLWALTSDFDITDDIDFQNLEMGPSTSYHVNLFKVELKDP